MTKQELLRSAWVPITKRLPPDTMDWIVCWGYSIRQPVVMEGFMARIIAKKVLEGDVGNIAKDRLISDWQPRAEPR